MQVILEDEDEGEYGRKTSTVGVVIRAGGIGRCMERKCNRGNRSRRSRVQIGGGVFDKSKKGIWWRRRRIS